jgi:Ion transport protein
VLDDRATELGTVARETPQGISSETHEGLHHECSMSDRKDMATEPVTRKDSCSSPSQPAELQSETVTIRDQLRRLYFGESRTAQQFRYGLLVFDAVTIAFIVGTSFLPRTTWLEWLDLIFGLVILADFSARLFVSPRPAREFAHPATWADMVAIVSFLAPVVGEGLGFLRILRTLRLLHTYQLTARLRADSLFFSSQRGGNQRSGKTRGIPLHYVGRGLPDTTLAQSGDRQLC